MSESIHKETGRHMILGVKLFARAKELAGTDLVHLDILDGANVAELRVALAERFPQMSAIVPRLLVSVDSEYADETTLVDSKAEVACFPPVSGG